MNDAYHIAAVDLGSNSFHMIIVRVEGARTVKVDAIKEMVRLRQGLGSDGSLSPEACERALACLARFGQRLRGIPKKHIRVVGTNTLRMARNAYDFLEAIKATLKVPVEIIWGREEARLIFQAVAQELPPRETRTLVIDIGGGSTEFVLGHGRNPMVLESRPMGCVSYSLRFFPDGVITKRGFQDAHRQVAYELEPYYQAFCPANRDQIIGTSGTAKATAAILTEMGLTKNEITPEGLKHLRRCVLGAGHVDYLNLPGLKADRAPVFCGGLAVLSGVFKALKISNMTISSQSLREGVILDFLDREERDKRVETVTSMMNFYRVDATQATMVRSTALALFPQIKKHITHPKFMAKRVLGWAADLHEIGLLIAHSGYHKHGAYILMNGDMQGFSATEQGLLSFLVVNQRKSLKANPLPFEEELDWPMVLVLRLAVILHRERRPIDLPKIEILWETRVIQVKLCRAWLDDHPLTKADLEVERYYWTKIGMDLKLK